MKDFALEANTNNFRWKNSSLIMTESYLEYMSQKVRCCLSLLTCHLLAEQVHTRIFTITIKVK